MSSDVFDEFWGPSPSDDGATDPLLEPVTVEEAAERLGWSIDAVREVVIVFPGSVAGMVLWAEKPSLDLDGRTPRDSVQQGDLNEVLVAARALTSAAW